MRRFGAVGRGPPPINSRADYIACHHPSYVRKFDLLAAIREGGGHGQARPKNLDNVGRGLTPFEPARGAIFVLNCPWTTVEQIEENLSNRLKKVIATRKVTTISPLLAFLSQPPKRDWQ